MDAFVLMVAGWAAFATLVVRSPALLDGAWRNVRAYSWPAEVVIWILLLPWMLGVAAWETRWPKPVRQAVVVVLAAGWIVLFYPRGG